MATSAVSRRTYFCTSDLNIVLLGGRSCGKSAVGNILLNKEEFVTRERITCSRGLGEVAGRWIAVVDTPGWWCDFSAQDTPQMVKREIVHSVSLCPPGPHVFLIVIKMSSEFSEKRRRALYEHLILLTEKVWSHCLVVFTCSVWSQHTTAEQHVGKCGLALQWLSDRCCQRCHIIAFNGKPVGTQVTDLLIKIQELVRENRGRHFEMEIGILQDIAEEKRTIEERAQQRLMTMKKQKSLLQGEVGHLSEISVVLLGASGSGKSSSGNTILGRGGSLEIQSRTAKCITGSNTVSGRHIIVVDTPGWWMNYFAHESPAFDKRELLRSLSLCSPGPHALLLVIRVDKAFTETYWRAVQEHLELLSETVWTHTIVLFSFGDWLGDTTIEQYIESEGEALRWLVEKCGNRYHVLNNRNTGDGFQVSGLMEKIEEMVAGNCGRCYEMEGEVLHKLQERIETEEEKGRERLARKQAQKEVTRPLLDKLNSPSPMKVILLGSKNTGKSSTGNTILGRKVFDVGSQTTCCVEGHSRVRGSTVTVLDTPGWLSADPYPPTTPTALLLLVNASSSFPLSLWEATQKHMEHLGERGWKRVVVLFTFGNWLGDTSIEQRIESEGEPLRSLVERCGNRYHVLDNKDWGGGAQVRELVELIEEMLVAERLEMLQIRAPRWKDVPAMPELHVGGAAAQVEDLNVWSTDRSSSNVFEAATLTKSLFPDHSRNLAVCGQVAVLPGEASHTTTSGLTFHFDFASLPHGYQEQRWAVEGRQTLVVKLPDWLVCGFEDCLTVVPNGKSHASVSKAEHHAVIVVAPVHQESTTRGKMLREKREEVGGIHSLSHPRLRERALKKLVKSGGLQALIDQWGDSSVEELESFIDSYFEMLWKDTMESVRAEHHDCQTSDAPEQDEEKEHGREVLSSIDKKLSKLDLLEVLQKDIVDLKQSVEHSWKILQECRDQSKGKREPSVQTGTEETGAHESSG